MGFADDMQARLHEFAMTCVKFTRGLPATDEGREWGGQLRRASTAASAIYRASRRGKSKPDWLDKIADGLGDEHLQRLRSAGRNADDDTNSIHQSTNPPIHELSSVSPLR
jgi:four helix bundle protein